MQNARAIERTGKPILVSNTAATMLSTLYPNSAARRKSALAQIAADIEDPAKVDRIVGHDDVFVAQNQGMRIIFKREGDVFVITSISAER